MATASAVLAINAGSSSLKSALFTFEGEPQPLAREALDGGGLSAVPHLLEWVDGQTRHVSLAAIGHRIVHGGPHYRDPQRVTPAVLDTLRQLIPFAPNHLPDEIALVEALGRHRSAVPQVVCFDTAFHADLPDVVRRLPIPAAYDARGVRRYGFHGLSYAFLLQALERLAGPEVAAGRVNLARLEPHRRPRTSKRRHDDGVHADGGSRHEYAIRRSRSRHRHVSRAK